MSKNETIEAAAEKYCHSAVGGDPEWSYGDVKEAFYAGAKWQGEKVGTLEADNAKLEKERDDWHGAYDQMVSDLVHGRDHFIKWPVNGVGIPRLVPRMPSVSGVSQTEIMAEILGLKDQLHSVLSCMASLNDVDLRFNRLHAVVEDVGQKVEAVLSVVTEEPETVIAGVDMAKPGSDKTVFSFVRSDGKMHNVAFVKDQEASDALRERLRVAEISVTFWRKLAATRSEYAAMLREQIMQMGDMLDALTGQGEKG